MTARLPSYSSAALACLSLAPDCQTAVLVYADQRLVEVTARYTAFSQVQTTLQTSQVKRH